MATTHSPSTFCAATPSALPSFTGRVIARDTLTEDEFRIYAYQYASTSMPDKSMWPAAILYAADDEDIQKAILYASENDLGIAVRSGGHHYIGMSSTSGMNIQIDLSGKLAPSRASYPYAAIQYDGTKKHLTMGCGTTMEEVSKVCADLGVFFPHGECSSVHTGGHTQTGGVSVLTRSFGLMCDYIQSIDILLASGEKRRVHRHSGDPLDNDLFFALIGGSPGNFGVVTATTVKVMRDKDHPHACAVKVAFLYHKETMRQLLQLINWFNDDRDAPADLCVSVLSIGSQHTPNFHPLASTTFDDEMGANHSNLAGEYTFNYLLPVVCFIASWTNLKGAAVKGIDNVSKWWLDRFLSVKGTIVRKEFDHLVPMPLSSQLVRLTWENPREYSLPYVKRLYWAKDSFRLAQPDEGDGRTLADWVAERCDEVQSLWNVFRSRGMKIAIQVAPFGSRVDGTYLHRRDPVPMALGCRNANYLMALHLFYDPAVPGAYDKAKMWCDENDKAMLANKYHFNFHDQVTGLQSRCLWAPFNHRDEVANIDVHWKYYYDSEEVYQRLLDIKRSVDPKHVFSPNLYCVGASSLQRFADLPGAKTGEAPPVLVELPLQPSFMTTGPKSGEPPTRAYCSPMNPSSPATASSPSACFPPSVRDDPVAFAKSFFGDDDPLLRSTKRSRRTRPSSMTEGEDRPSEEEARRRRQGKHIRNEHSTAVLPPVENGASPSSDTPSSSEPSTECHGSPTLGQPVLPPPAAITSVSA